MSSLGVSVFAAKSVESIGLKEARKKKTKRSTQR